MMKPPIDISITSSQNFFQTHKTKVWNKDSAPILVGIGIRSPENIGAMIRLAGNVGCIKLLFVGNEEDHKMAKIKKTATTAFKKVNWQFISYANWLNEIPSDYALIALETTPDSQMIYRAELPPKVAFIVGDERYGIDIKTLSHCNSKVYIPMPSTVLSLNVVQAAAIALFELLRRNIQ